MADIGLWTDGMRRHRQTDSMARVPLFLLLALVVATIACVSAASTGTPILRLSSSTGGAAPVVVASSSAAPVVVASSSTGSVAPVLEDVFVGSYSICQIWATHSSCQQGFALSYGESNCINVDAASSTVSVSILPNRLYAGRFNWSESVYASLDCAGVGQLISAGSRNGPAGLPLGQWTNFTFAPVLVATNSAATAYNVTLGWTADLSLQIAPPTPAGDGGEEGPDVQPLAAVLICAGVLLLALVCGTSIMKSWQQTTKFAPAGTIAGDAIAAGSYGKF